MTKLTATEKTIARMRERRARLLNEVATLDKMLAAADGKFAAPSITVGPLVPVQPPVPFYPMIQPVVPYRPHCPPPGMTGPFPGFPFGDTIICATGEATYHNGYCIDSMPSIPVGLGGAALAITATHVPLIAEPCSTGVH